MWRLEGGGVVERPMRYGAAGATPAADGPYHSPLLQLEFASPSWLCCAGAGGLITAPPVILARAVVAPGCAFVPVSGLRLRLDVFGCHRLFLLGLY